MELLNFKMLSFILFLIIFMLLNVLTNANPSPEPALSNPYSFISNPSFYSYTIDNNQNSVKRYQQQQQQQQQIKSNNDLNNKNNNNYSKNNNYINFATNGNYYTENGISNRNFYTVNDIKSHSSISATSSTFTTQSAQLASTANGCTLDRLAVYKVVLHTYWTRDLFPKHYPDWRPTAQWTKTIGRTHDAAYALYHIGQQATAGVKQFAETGKTDMIDSISGEQQQFKQQQKQQQQQQQQATSNGNLFREGNAVGNQQKAKNTNYAPIGNGEQQQQQQRSVFDEFSIPAINNGDGRSEAKFFVDSNHSLVSLMTRIVPSPDWFIGVDSFQLCVGGSWIDTVTVEMDPLDAGTDNGFTFTAPNWPTSPQGVIYRITSRYPAHPAGSFFYPKSKRLPPIATFQFIKLKEYELSEVFNFAEDDRKYELVSTQTHLETEHSNVEMNNELSASIERERQNEISSQPKTTTERDRIRSRLLAKMNPMYNNNKSITSGNGGGGLAAANAHTNVVPKNDKNALMQNIADSYRSRTEVISKQQQHQQQQLQHRRRTKRPGDCRVSHWSEWTPCSKTCGIGEMHRYRKVIKHGKRGGRPCPALQESKWCGSDKGCHSPASYFNWSDT